MASKFKLTGFARFFFAMIIIVPLAYFGASYYNGEDGVENLKKMVGIDVDTEEDSSTTTISKEKASDSRSDNKGDSNEITRLNNKIDQLEKENERLNQLLKNRDREIELLKNQ